MNEYEFINLFKAIFQCTTTFKEAITNENAFTRNRKMSFFQALCFLLDMNKTSLSNRLNKFFGFLGKTTAISQQAFSKLRAKFDHSPFVKLFYAMVKKEYNGSHQTGLWKGRHIFAVDGVRFKLPNTKQLLEKFGVFGSLDSVSAGASVLFDVIHGWVLDVQFAMAKMNERTECLKHIHFLTTHFKEIANNCIILFDRGYPSQKLFIELIRSGIQFVIRCPSNSLVAIAKAPIGVSIITLKGVYRVRVIKFRLRSGEIATLVSNVFDLSEEDFQKLYSLRWGIETMFDTLKNKLNIEKVSGKTLNSVMQDFWASLVLMNTAALFNNIASKELKKKLSGTKNKNEQKIAISKLIVTLRDHSFFPMMCANPIYLEFNLIKIIPEIVRNRVSVIPGRSFPRNIPKGRRKIRNNLKSCLAA
ncbi:MAG: transposase [Oscillospiraceae bacterium]|jgi:hypothetical protein|nr:transposase [Oscillospiraceae bacterium]